MKKYYFKKGMDDRSIYLINNFIDEFEEIFGKYLSREEVIQRIEENLNDFYFIDLDDIEGNREYEKVVGRYYLEKKHVQISGDLDEKYIKGVVFHELIHCITNKDGKIGFSYNNIFGEYVDTSGFNEGFTQLATKKRNKKYNEEGKNSYPILTEQVENFVKIIGEDNFYNIAFNYPKKITEICIEEGLTSSEVDVQFFFKAFNQILIQEKEILRNRTFEGMLHKKIFGVQDDFRSRLTIAKNDIIKFYTNFYNKKSIKSVEELNEIFYKLNKYAEQLDNKESNDIYDIVITKIDELMSKKIINEENFNMLDDELIKIYNENQHFKEFMNLSAEDKLKQLSNPEEMDWLFESRFIDIYQTLISESIFIDKNSTVLLDSLTYGVANIIIDKKYDVQKLCFEVIEFPGKIESIINVYEHSLKDKKYLCTLSNFNNDFDFIEIKPQGREDTSLVFEDEFGNIFKYNNNKEHVFIDNTNAKSIKSKKTTYIKSNLEQLYLNFIKILKNYEKAKKEGYPEIMINDYESKYIKNSKMVQEILKEELTLQELIDLQKSYEELEEK